MPDARLDMRGYARVMRRAPAHEAKEVWLVWEYERHGVARASRPPSFGEADWKEKTSSDKLGL